MPVQNQNNRPSSRLLNSGWQLSSPPKKKLNITLNISSVSGSQAALDDAYVEMLSELILTGTLDSGRNRFRNALLCVQMGDP